MSLNGKKLVIGVDGGATKTQAILMEEGGRILAEGRFPSSNPHAVSKELLRQTIGALVETLVVQGNVEVSRIDGMCMGMAGCDRPEDRAYLEGIVREFIGPTVPLLIVNDAVVALVAAMKRLHGLLLISGTGSICYGFNGATGQSARCGGFGHHLADEGSGYSIGIKALRAVMQEFDGRGAATSLTARLVTELNLRGPEDLIGWTYMSGHGKTEIAALSLYVHQEDEKGDSVASAILDSEADELFRLIPPVFKKLFFSTTEKQPLVLWGGNLLNAKKFQARLVDRVEKSNLMLYPVASDERAVIGAAWHMVNQLNLT